MISCIRFKSSPHMRSPNAEKCLPFTSSPGLKKVSSRGETLPHKNMDHGFQNNLSKLLDLFEVVASRTSSVLVLGRTNLGRL